MRVGGHFFASQIQLYNFQKPTDAPRPSMAVFSLLVIKEASSTKSKSEI